MLPRSSRPRPARYRRYRVGLSGEEKMEKPTEEQIRNRALDLWELAGKPEDRDEEFWQEAEKELNEGLIHESIILPG
jgi:hypothetical protein